MVTDFYKLIAKKGKIKLKNQNHEKLKLIFENTVMSCMRPCHGEMTSRQEAHKLKFLLLGI